jgi:Flp pilus assembly protein TadG
MIRRTLGRLLRDSGGSTALEFALTALALVMLIIGVGEFGAVCWAWQVLEATAGDAARCAGLNATSCKNAATTPINTQNYAASAALGRGFSGVTASSVTVTTGAAAQTTCATTAPVVVVAINYTFSWAALVPMPSTVTASACFPLASS